MPVAALAASQNVGNGENLTSGNMDEKDLRDVAATGVDFISIGALTNSANPLDISLKFI